MMPVMLLTLLLLPAAAAAQENAASSDPSPARDTVTFVRGWSVRLDESALTRPPAQQPPAARAERRRRRPSMVGYIGDATVQSQIRLRFDAGMEITAPDRAEFFYAKCGCYRDLPPSHAAFDPEAAGPGPGIATDLDFQQLYAHAEYAPRDRFSVFAELPVRWLKPQGFVPGTGSFGDQTGISDLRAGVKLALLANEDASVTVQLLGSLPTGDSRKGLGTDHASIEPALLVNRRLADRAAVEAQFGAVLPTGGSNGIATTEEKFAGNILYYGIGPSFEIYSSDELRFAPVVELVGWHLLSGFQTSTFTESDGTNIVNLKVGGRFVFRDRSSFYAGYGFALTDDDWYDKIFRIEYRYAF